jgi:hypothetical protein
MRPVTHEWLVALDLDRTLIREAASVAALKRACKSVGFDTSAMLAAENAITASGQSFQPLEYLRTQESEEDISIFLDIFMDNLMKENLLYHDVELFIDILNKHKIPFIILTYGENVYQQIKIQAAGLADHNCIVTRVKKKGSLIAGWKNTETDQYIVPAGKGTIQARHILLVDDKASSFYGLPADCKGALVRRPGEKLVLSQQGNVGSGVQNVASLKSIFSIFLRKIA